MAPELLLQLLASDIVFVAFIHFILISFTYHCIKRLVYFTRFHHLRVAASAFYQ
jgi:hypothetical protein